MLYDTEAQEMLKQINLKLIKSRDEYYEEEPVVPKEEPKPETKKREFKFLQKPFSDKAPQFVIPKF